MRKLLYIFSGPLTGGLVYLIFSLNNLSHPVSAMAFVTAWMAVWWITEAVEIGVTSMLPFVLLPLLNILKAEEVAVQYMEQTIFLFIGGFFLAYALEKWDIHHRLAYRIILFTGSSPSRILAGIMLTAYLISMWISNTATTLMLVSAVSAIATRKELFKPESMEKNASAFLIALAYSATIGGMSTIVGTPTNMIFTGYWETNYPDREPISFVRWCVFGIPFSLAMLAAGYFLLVKFFRIEKTSTDKSFICEQYVALGPVTREQISVMVLFAITVILWFTRTTIEIGSIRFGGWEKLFPKGYIKDSTVAIAAAIAMFVIPSGEKGKFILEWNDVKRLPLHIILLFGGGFALAKGIEVSGLGEFLASQLHFFEHYPAWTLIAALAVLVTLLSELASNVATITLMLPIIASLSEAINIDPIKVMVPATFAASFGFMLVIATAPNTIAYATGLFSSRNLFRVGLWMNLVGIALLTIAMMLVDF
jgi:sodium-dependent dicarboxylate transporter 2/3/5